MPLTQLTSEAAARLRAAQPDVPEAAPPKALARALRHLNRTVLLGSGPRAFAGAAGRADELAHLGQASGVSASGPHAAAGRTSCCTCGSAVRLTAPCRVVYVIDEPDCRGFAYGTLSVSGKR